MVYCLLHNFIRRKMPCDPFEDAFDTVNEEEPLGGSTITSIKTSEEWSTLRTNLALKIHNQWSASRRST